ncbi:hypothetical protein ERAQ111492_05135 [Erysipelothrix aquatica]
MTTLQTLIEYSFIYSTTYAESDANVNLGFWGVNLSSICTYLQRILDNIDDYRIGANKRKSLLSHIDQLRAHYAKTFQFNKLDFNPLEYVDSDVSSYKKLLELQIDLQIAFALYGYVELIEDLVACVSYQVKHFEQRDQMPFGSLESSKKEFQRINEKYKRIENHK